MDSTPMIDGLLRSLSDLHDACRDLDIDQIIIAPGGRWTIRKLGHVHRHPTPLNGSDVQSLQQLMSSSGQGLAAKLGWLFRLHPSLDGWAIWGERLPVVNDALVEPQSAQAMQLHVEKGSNGVIIGPPGSRKNHVLAWLAKHYVQEQIVFVSELPPKETFGPRVLHLFPPRDRADARVFSRFLSQCDVVLWDRIAHPYDLQDCMGYVGATHRWMTFDAQSQQIGIAAFAKMWNQQNWGTLDAIILTEIRRHTVSAISGMIHRDAGHWQSIDNTEEALFNQVVDLFDDGTTQTTPTRQPEQVITVDLPNHSISNEQSNLRITTEAQEHSRDAFLADPSDSLLIPKVKTTFTGPPQSEEELHPFDASETFGEVSASYNDIFEDSEGSSFAEVSEPLEEASIPEETTPSVVISKDIEEPHTEELELDILEEHATSSKLDPMPEAQPTTSSDIWETTQEYVADEQDDVLPENTYEDIAHPSMMPADESRNVKTPIAQAAILPPPNLTPPEPAPVQFEPMNVEITNNVSGAQLDALLPQLSEGFDDEDEFDDPNALQEAQVKDLLGIQTDAPIIMSDVESRSPTDDALQALDSLYDLPTSNNVATVGDDDSDDITVSGPMPEPPKAEVIHPRVKKLAWGDDEETISRSMPPQYPIKNKPEPPDATSTSSSIRLNNLSQRLKTLRQQRLEGNDDSIPPSPPDNITPPATAEEEPTQITTLPDPEPKRPDRFVIRNKEELLKRLKQHSQD